MEGSSTIPWHPLRFVPRYQERIWGGRSLAALYGRELPPGRPIGESWEIVDRPEAESVVAEGPLQGRTLRELMAAAPEGVLGDAVSRDGRFPLLVKILDARDVLSLQVHPPAAKARELGGEPKTEAWYFTAAEADAGILAGLRRGTTRAEFERRLGDGTVAECFHRAAVRAGDAMFLPSGRVHALGAGVVLFEIQENSDTTYRVYDWNRPGLDGRPRALHVAESLASIDFDDFEPGLVDAPWRDAGGWQVKELAAAPAFRVWLEATKSTSTSTSTGPATTNGERRERVLRGRVVGVVRGELEVEGCGRSLRLGAGDFCLLPAALGEVAWRCAEGAEWICAEPGSGRTGACVPGVGRGG